LEEQVIFADKFGFVRLVKQFSIWVQTGVSLALYPDVDLTGNFCCDF